VAVQLARVYSLITAAAVEPGCRVVLNIDRVFSRTASCNYIIIMCYTYEDSHGCMIPTHIIYIYFITITMLLRVHTRMWPIEQMYDVYYVRAQFSCLWRILAARNIAGNK